MNAQIVCVLLPLLWCILPQNSGDRGWRGIIPLHSSEIDVRKRLGTPNGGPLVDYKFEDVNVNFDYSSGNCNDGWDVPAGTVLRIKVNLKKTWPKLSDLGLDLRQYEKTNDPELLDITYYESKKAGITYVVWRDEVKTIYYDPSEDDKHLRCKTDK